MDQECFFRRDRYSSAENQHIFADDYARHAHVQRRTGIKISHLKTILRIKHVLLAALAANVAIPVVYVFGITIAMRLWYEPFEVQHILVGLALVAAMPIAGSSTAWAQNADG